MLNPNVVSLFVQLKNTGYLTSLDSVMELGDQQLGLENRTNLIRDFLHAFGSGTQEVSDDQVRELTKGPARKLYEAVGARYVCLDTAEAIDTDRGRHEVTPFDLNFDEVSGGNRGRYDLVTNLGVTEHVLNQANCFKCCHDFTAVGGYMFHGVPCWGFSDQYYFNYQPIFFQELSHANGYELIGIWISLPTLTDHFIAWQDELLPHLKLDGSRKNVYAHIAVMMRKVEDSDFHYPFQGQYERVRSSQMAERYQIVGGEVRPDHRLLPMEPGERLRRISGWDIQRELLARYKNRLLRWIGRR